MGGSVELNRQAYTLCPKPRTRVAKGKRVVHQILNIEGGLFVHIFFIFIGVLHDFLY